jgi:hypothetical protein
VGNPCSAASRMRRTLNFAVSSINRVEKRFFVLLQVPVVSQGQPFLQG